jgi:hypothetical protein
MNHEEVWICWYNTWLARYSIDRKGKLNLENTAPTKEDSGVLHQPDFLIRDPRNPDYALFTSAGPSDPGVYRVKIDGKDRPTAFFVGDTLESPRGIAHAQGHIFIADNPTIADRPGYYNKGIVVLTKTGVFKKKILVPDDVSDYVPVAAHGGKIYFATNLALYRIEKKGNGPAATFTYAKVEDLPEPFCRGLASHANGLYVLCRGEQWGSQSVLYLYDPASPNGFTMQKGLGRAYTGIAARPNGLLLTAFFAANAGDAGEICYYDFVTQTEDSILKGDWVTGTENPLGIIAVTVM